MQLKNIEGSRFKLQASGGKAEHIMGLEQAVGSLSTTEDLILHCKNNSIIRTNKMVLLFSSKLFSKLLTETCPCPSALSQEYDVICPGNFLWNKKGLDKGWPDVSVAGRKIVPKNLAASNTCKTTWRTLSSHNFLKVTRSPNLELCSWLLFLNI